VLPRATRAELPVVRKCPLLDGHRAPRRPYLTGEVRPKGTQVRLGESFDYRGKRYVWVRRHAIALGHHDRARQADLWGIKDSEDIFLTTRGRACSDARKAAHFLTLYDAQEALMRLPAHRQHGARVTVLELPLWTG
jgi:hypothetical protein